MFLTKTTMSPFPPPFGLVPGALTPNVDYDVHLTIEFNRFTGKGRYRATGWHNLFPAYEVVAGQYPIYEFQPEGSGPNPYNLNGWTNIEMNWIYFWYVS